MLLKNLSILTAQFFASGWLYASSSTSTDLQLASCLQNIYPNQNMCSVTLDDNYPEQAKLSDAIKKAMDEGYTYHLILMDAAGNRYETLEEWQEATEGRTYLIIYYASPTTFSIRTGINEPPASVSRDRRDNDFRFAIDSLIKDLTP